MNELAVVLLSRQILWFPIGSPHLGKARVRGEWYLTDTLLYPKYPISYEFDN